MTATPRSVRLNSLLSSATKLEKHKSTDYLQKSGLKMKNIEIIEQFSKGKRKDQTLNEDALVITDKYIAVIDGASSADKFDGISGGLLAKELLTDELYKLTEYNDGFEALTALNGRLFEFQKKYPDARSNPAKRLMASIIIYNISKEEIWSYGDCKCLINGAEYSFNKKIDTLNANVRSFINQAELETGKTAFDLLNDDIGAKAIAKLIEYQPIFANKNVEFGYPILDGFNLNESFFQAVKIKHGDEIIFATDGYPKLFNNLADCENYLADCLKKDLLCIQKNRTVKGCYKNLNSFDDRTYIKFIVK